LSALFEVFKKVIPELMIDDSERNRIKTELRDKDVDDLALYKKKVDFLQSQVDSIKGLMDRKSSES